MSVYSYADESGTHDDSKIVVIAGWVSTRKRWLKFCRQWQHELNQKRAPYLHMKELNRSARPKNKFRKWSQERTDKFVHAMIPIARDNAIFGLICAIDMAGYKSLHPGLFVSDYPTPYVYAFQLFFEEMLKVLNGATPFKHGIAMDEVCHPVFDQGPHQESAHRAFSLLTKFKDQRNRYGNIGFAHHKDYVDKQGMVIKATLPLQAADLLAYHAYSIYLLEAAGKKLERRSPGWELKASGKLLVSHINEQDSIEFSKRVQNKYGL